jgi:hypothetical protein
MFRICQNIANKYASWIYSPVSAVRDDLLPFSESGPALPFVPAYIHIPCAVSRQSLLSHLAYRLRLLYTGASCVYSHLAAAQFSDRICHFIFTCGPPIDQI